MNNIAISPDIFMHMLQNQNIKHQVVRKFDSIKPIDANKEITKANETTTQDVKESES